MTNVPEQQSLLWITMIISMSSNPLCFVLLCFIICIVAARDPLVESFLKYTNTPLSFLNNDDIDKEFDV